MTLASSRCLCSVAWCQMTSATDDNTSASTRTQSEGIGQGSMTSCCRASATPLVSGTYGASPTCATATGAERSSYLTSPCCVSPECRSSSWSCLSASSAATALSPAGASLHCSKVIQYLFRLLSVENKIPYTYMNITPSTQNSSTL